MLKSLVCLTVICFLHQSKAQVQDNSLTEILAECSNNLAEHIQRQPTRRVLRGKAGPRGPKGDVGSCDPAFVKRFEDLHRKVENLLEREEQTNELVARLSEGELYPRQLSFSTYIIIMNFSLLSFCFLIYFHIITFNILSTYVVVRLLDFKIGALSKQNLQKKGTP